MIPLVSLKVKNKFRKESKEMSKEVQIAVRVEKDMYDKLTDIANKDDRSVAYVVRKIIAEYLREKHDG